MMPPQKTALTEFKEVIREVRTIAALCSTGFIAAPLVAKGFSPAWPGEAASMTIQTTIVEILGAIWCFFYISKKSERAARLIYLTIFSTLVFSAAYLIATDIFIVSVGTPQTKIVLGCGLNENAKAVYADRYHVPPKTSCPGDENVKGLVEESRWHAQSVYQYPSVEVVRLLIFLLWLASFASLSILLAAFVVVLKNQRIRAAPKRTRPS